MPYEPVVFSKNAEVLEAVKTAQVDMAFTNASAERAKDMDFGPPYLEIELGYPGKSQHEPIRRQVTQALKAAGAVFHRY